MRAVVSGIAVSLLAHAGIAAQVPAREEGLSAVARVAALQPVWAARVETSMSDEVAPAGGPVSGPAPGRTPAPGEAPVRPQLPVRAETPQEMPVLTSASPAAAAPATLHRHGSPRPTRTAKVRRQPVRARSEANEVATTRADIGTAAEATGGAMKTPPTAAAGTVAETASGPPGARTDAGTAAGAGDAGPGATGELVGSDGASPPSGPLGGRDRGRDEGRGAARVERLARVAEATGRVARGLRYPKAARRLGLEGEVLVRCRPDGSRWEVSIARSSGVEHFDREALRATRDALADMPADGDGFVLPVRFRLVDTGGLAGARDGVD